MSIEQKSKILADDIITALDSKASTSHSSTDTTYGIGNETSYGHVKVSDSASSTSDASSGVAASPKAVKTAYDKAVEALEAVANVKSTITITYWE